MKTNDQETQTQPNRRGRGKQRRGMFPHTPTEEHQHTWLNGEEVQVCSLCGAMRDKPKEL